jgi:hypothetical protein
MRTEWRMPRIYWHVVIVSVVATGCRVWLEDHHHRDDLEGRPRYVTSPTPARRGIAERHERKYASLVPVLDCVERLERGGLRAHFGYENGYDDKLYVPISDHNEFRPWPKDRDQPIHFKPGTHERVVSVTLDDSESVTWVLEGAKAVADADSPRCKDESDSDPDPDPDGDDEGCERSASCASDAGLAPIDAGTPRGPAHPDRDTCDGSRGANDCGERDASPPSGGVDCGCEDAGAAPSGVDAAIGDERCPESAQFAAHCVGSLRCGPYHGPVRANCTSSCPCGDPETYTVPLPTIAECIDGRWELSFDREALADACGEAPACDCLAGSGAAGGPATNAAGAADSGAAGSAP